MMPEAPENVKKRSRDPRSPLGGPGTHWHLAIARIGQVASPYAAWCCDMKARLLSLLNAWQLGNRTLRTSARRRSPFVGPLG
jgi:hypothetical protein